MKNDKISQLDIGKEVSVINVDGQVVMDGVLEDCYQNEYSYVFKISGENVTISNYSVKSNIVLSKKEFEARVKAKSAVEKLKIEAYLMGFVLDSIPDDKIDEVLSHIHSIQSIIDSSASEKQIDDGMKMAHYSAMKYRNFDDIKTDVIRGICNYGTNDFRNEMKSKRVVKR